MNTEEEKGSAAPEPKKKRKISIPFVIIGVVLLAGLIPVGDVDGDGGTDLAGQWLMLKVMTMQENAKAQGENSPPKKSDKPLQGMSGGGGPGGPMTGDRPPGGGGSGASAEAPEPPSDDDADDEDEDK